ncbi:MAG: DUF421 domain-containing protein [Firmicutes bacterium]|nr:DUF421 domain-containing protein [Dethiobacter sp.]MBS3888987.1 DUF421 domain-containing protein [Bacillota bacterium]
MTLLGVVLRTGLSFMLLFLMVRLVGKQQLSQMTFFDFISGITIGSLAAISATDLEAAWKAWLAIVIWTAFTILAAKIALYNRQWRKLIDGEPTILIHKGKILENNLGKVRYTMDDLRTQLRVKGAFSLGDVEYAILETTGEISVMKNPQQEPPVRQDFLFVGQYTGLETELIVDSEIVYENLKSLQKDEKWLRDMLAAFGVQYVSEVAYCSVDERGKFYVDRYDDKMLHMTDPSDYKVDEFINSDLPQGKSQAATKNPKI